MIEVQERSAKSFVARFLNSSRALSAPTTARWRLKNLETGEIVKDWTSISSPTSEETITVTSDLNTIRAGCAREHYELVVQRDHADTSAKQTRSIVYRVINISSVDD